MWIAPAIFAAHRCKFDRAFSGRQVTELALGLAAKTVGQFRVTNFWNS